MTTCARRSFLHLTTGAVLTAICGVATAQARSAHFIVGYLRHGATDIIVRLIRQWLAERGDRSLVMGGQMNIQNGIAAGMGEQCAVSPTHVLGSAQTPVAEILRTWAHQRLTGVRISS